MPGRPSDRLSYRRAAALVGVKPKTWLAYVARKKAPPPDGKDPEFGRNFWFRSTILKYMRERPRQGARTDLRET